MLHRDGLIDAASGRSMGDLADIMAEQENISRQQQDEYTIQSIVRAVKAHWAHVTDWEKTPLDGAEDDLITQFEAMAGDGAETEREHRLEAALRELSAKRAPCFRMNEPTANRTITAFNSSGLSDGAAALLVANEETVRRLREYGAPPPLAEIVSYSDAALDPELYCVAPTDAITNLL